MIRPYRLSDEPALRDIYARCHPDASPRPEWWFIAYPTLVATDPDDQPIGFTSWTLAPTETGFVMHGVDVCVDPPHRKQGLGRILADLRLDIARNVGAVTFIGNTRPDNTPMLRIFGRQRLRCVQETPDYFGAGQSAVFYAGEVMSR